MWMNMKWMREKKWGTAAELVDYSSAFPVSSQWPDDLLQARFLSVLCRSGILRVPIKDHKQCSTALSLPLALYMQTSVFLFCFFLWWISNGCMKALVTAKLAFLLQFFMALKTTDQWRSSWKILFNERRFRASLYIIWLEASQCLWSAEHWMKLEIYCSWCVERSLIILVTQACCENAVCAPTYWRL